MKDIEFKDIMFKAIEKAYLDNGMNLFGESLLCASCQRNKVATRNRVRKFRSKIKGEVK